MNIEAKGNPGCLEIPTKVTSHIIIPITLLFLILSVYCGWKVNSILTGQLLTQKTLDVIIDPSILIKLQKYGYFQFYLFIFAIISIGLSFIFKTISLFQKNEVTGAFFLTIIGIFVFLVIVTFILGCEYLHYNECLEKVSKLKNKTASAAQVTNPCSQDRKVRDEKEKKVTEEKTKRSADKQKHRVSDTLYKEMFYAVRDITKLLMNWAILLITGLGYIIVRMLKLI